MKRRSFFALLFGSIGAAFGVKVSPSAPPKIKWETQEDFQRDVALGIPIRNRAFKMRDPICFTSAGGPVIGCIFDYTQVA